jgi:hypothetical protein
MRHSRSIWFGGVVAPALQYSAGNVDEGFWADVVPVVLIEEFNQLFIRRPLRLGLGQGGAGADKQIVVRLINSVCVERGMKLSAKRSEVSHRVAPVSQFQ